MGTKRIKIHRGVNSVVPVTINISQLESADPDNYKVSGDMSDGGLEKQRLEDNLEYEEMVVQILCNLDTREQLIFIFQLLRDNGYQIDHGSFAKVVNLSRRQYMRILEDVRIKVALLIVGYSRLCDGNGSHKESK